MPKTAAKDSSRFAYPLDDFKQLSRDLLKAAKAKGATDAEVEVSEGYGLNLTVRKGELETLEHNRDKGMGLTVYIGQRKGHASSSDLSEKALADTLDAALNIARFTAADDCAGLAEEARLARDFKNPSLYFPWHLEVDEAAELARRCEAAAFAVSALISNSEGASVAASHAQFVSANSRGFMGGFPSSRHYVSVSVIAAPNKRSVNGMQRDDWYSGVRDPADFAVVEKIGDYAARRALSRLHSRKLKTMQVPVLFDAPVATGLVGSFVSAASGGALYRKSTFLLDQAGKQIFAKNITITEDPTTPKGFATGPFDDDGVATKKREVVKNGVLKGYFLSTYSAKKLGLTSTGNAGGSHNLVVKPTVSDDLMALVRRMGRGLLVTEMMGHGINQVTGDYSRGAAGYWVEGGEIRYPVHEITIAGNLKDMYRNIAAVGADTVVRGSVTSGSVLVDGMTVAGE